MINFQRKHRTGSCPNFSLPLNAISSQGRTESITTTTNDDVVGFGGSAKSPVTLDKAVLGGKGVGLQTMSSIGIDVPPGFTLTTHLCQEYQKTGDLTKAAWDVVRQAIQRVQKDMGKKFGDAENPLLLSCRSGAAISMPGMMDTVLNVGLNQESVQGLAKATGNRRFAYDSYRRLLDMFGDVVLGIPHEAFESKLKSLKANAGVVNDVDLTAEQLEELCETYQSVYQAYDKDFPQDPYDQIKACIKAVFESWNADRAVKYREINGITNLLGTACNIQTMVFGNLGESSGTGVAFSRDPGTGANILKGEYLVNAQGEDVVAGIRTPEPISTMKDALPEAYEQFLKNVEVLEQHFKDMQDVEFTVENGKLWMLQCRSGKRTGHAALKIAADFEAEGICSGEDAIFMVETDHIKQVLHPSWSQETLESEHYKSNVIATGLAAGPGAAVGKLVFSTQRAEELADEGVILVRENTSPEDVGGMWASKGILTSRGGVTSHAAVVARGWGRPCICGCEEIDINEEEKTMTIRSSGMVFKEGDVVSLNGSTGEILGVTISLQSSQQDSDFTKVLQWADSIEDSCKIMANADSESDALKAIQLGAQGIGLCRTEHMFFAPDRLPVVRRWILRGEGLEKIKEFQKSDFLDIMKVMDGKPVTMRLLDPPLHEFLPKKGEVDQDFAQQLGYNTVADLFEDIEELHEENPMLGFRGCRLGISRPELTTAQVQAIMQAAADLVEDGKYPFPRIMIPLVGSVREFQNQALLVKKEAERVIQERGVNIQYEIGTMIEVPRAALVSDQIADCIDPKDGKRLCSFFSYGTNDLTQMTLGISRDDAGEFIPTYMDVGIYEKDPFKTIDEHGVGWLLHLSAAQGRSVNPSLSLSVCGEHGGDPDSISFFDKVGLDYMSCSPYRVPVARLAAGQSALKRRKAAGGLGETKKERLINSSPFHPQ